MASRLDSLLEAERRGILPEAQQGLLDEARRRGLVPPASIGAASKPSAAPAPTHRAAERESMEKLRADPPDTRQQPFLPRATYGMVSPSSTTALTATGGAVLGGPAGPGGMLGGGALGAAAGPPTFNLMENAYRSAKGLAPYRPDMSAQDIFRESAEEGISDLTWGMGTAAAGPAIRQLGKPLVGRALGVMNPQSRRITDLAQQQGIDVGAAHISPRKAVKGAAKVLGVFPFVGTPLRRGQAKVVGQLDDRAADILNTLAPTQTVQDVGQTLTQAAQRRFTKANHVASALYKRFYNIADNLPVREIVDTQPLKDTAAEMAERSARGQIQLTTGEPMRPFKTDQVGEFLKQIDDLPERITVEQAREMERTFNRTIQEAAKEGYDISRLSQIKGALEQAKNNLDVSQLPPEAADEVMGAWRKANEWFANTRRVFDTPTAQKFGRVDRNMFNKGVFKPGSLNPDEAFQAVFKSNSPEAMSDLRDLVGQKEFQKAARAYIEDAVEKSIRPAKEGSLVETLFSAADLEKRLGLNSESGRQALREALKGTDIAPKDFDNFVEAAKTATDITIRDPSTFLTRRLILGGSLAGGVMLAGGKVTVPSAALITYVARKTAKGLMSPTALRDMTRVLKDTVPDHQKRILITRLLRLGSQEDTQPRPDPLAGIPSGATPQSLGAL